MLLTYKLKHGQDTIDLLKKSRQVALFVLSWRKTHNKAPTTKDVKCFGLKSVVSKGIIKKIWSDKKSKNITRIKATISDSEAFKVVQGIFTIIPLKFSVDISRLPSQEIRQVEIGEEYIYICVKIQESKESMPTSFIGIDLNATGHCAVVANPNTGKVIKLGKKAYHIHRKYLGIRNRLQKLNKKRKLKVIRKRESNIVRDLNHKVSKAIVTFAKENNSGIKMEDLHGIRNSKNKKNGKAFKYSLNSWSFYQLRQFVEYKAKLLGIPVVLIDPRNTSKTCSKCGTLGQREGKSFKCPVCGHVDHADSNAAFNIACWKTHDQLAKDRDLAKGNTDIPQYEKLSTLDMLIA